MKALVLAAGFGTRLGALTKNLPKPLIEIGGKPVLAHCLEKLQSAGVREVIINTHYLSHQIHDFIGNFETKLKISLSHESKLLGTAGTLKKHLDFLSSNDFIVMHADNYFNDSLSEFVKDHQSRKVGKYGSVGTFYSDNPKNCGVMILNEDKTIKEYYEKVDSPPSNLANAAIFIFTPKIREPLKLLDKIENDISRHLLPKIKTDLYTHNFGGLFLDIGTPESLELANNYELKLKRSTTIFDT